MLGSAIVRACALYFSPAAGRDLRRFFVTIFGMCNMLTVLAFAGTVRAAGMVWTPVEGGRGGLLTITTVRALMELGWPEQQVLLDGAIWA